MMTTTRAGNDSSFLCYRKFPLLPQISVRKISEKAEFRGAAMQDQVIVE